MIWPNIFDYEGLWGFLNPFNDDDFQFQGLVYEEIQDGALWSLAEMPPILKIRLKLNFIWPIFRLLGFEGNWLPLICIV